MASNVVSDNFETSSGGVPQLGGTGATTCKAWVNFNGTGTVAIRDSYNVSSITDNGVGAYTLNFTVAMSNNSYSWTYGAVDDGTTRGTTIGGNTYDLTTTQLRNQWGVTDGSGDGFLESDIPHIHYQIFSN